MSSSIGASNPVLDKAIKNRGPKPNTGHDPLHNFEVYKSCWCMCSKCWRKYKTGGLGRCVCPQCPCNKFF